MRFALSNGTRRPFVILAWVLLPLTALALGAAGSQAAWRANQSADANLSQQVWIAHVISETTALQRVGGNVTFPSDFVTDTSSDPFLVGCGINVGRVGCWVDQHDVQTVTREIVKATAAAGMDSAATTCAKDGLRCEVVGELSNGEFHFTVISPQVEIPTTRSRPGSTSTEIWRSEISATVLPRDVFATS